MTLKSIVETLYHQLDMNPRTEAKDRALILKALQDAQAIKPKKRKRR